MAETKLFMVSGLVAALATLLSFLLKLQWAEAVGLIGLLSILGLLSFIGLKLSKNLSLQQEAYTEVWQVLSDLKCFAELGAAKLSYIELRLDRATATCRDSLRHLSTKLTEFDPSVGTKSVLSKWVSEEKDAWCLRRSPLGWRLLCAATEQNLLNEQVWLRIHSAGKAEDEKAEMALDEARIQSNLLSLTEWTTPEQAEDFGKAQLPDAQVPIAELFQEMTKHKTYLEELSNEMKVSWVKVTEGIYDFRCSGTSAASGHPEAPQQARELRAQS